MCLRLDAIKKLNIKNSHRLCGLNNKYIFFTVLKSGKCKNKVPAKLILGESTFPSFQRYTLLYLYRIERGSSGPFVSL